MAAPALAEALGARDCRAIFFKGLDVSIASGSDATLRLFLPADLDIATGTVPGGAVRPGSDGLFCAGGMGWRVAGTKRMGVAGVRPRIRSR